MGEIKVPNRIAYLPLTTYPEATPDAAIPAAIGYAAALGCGLHVSTFAVEIPQLASPLSGILLDVPELVQAAETRSKAAARHLQSLVKAGAAGDVSVTGHTVVLGGTLEAAAAEARYFDLTLLPWTSGTVAEQDMAQVMVFGSGRPTVLLPAATAAAKPAHIAIAWDESAVAARALGDALALLPAGGRISVLTVQDEKALSNASLAQTLAAALALRGYEARAVALKLGDRTIAAALQDAALQEGAQLLAMGGFGHSRLRDFILGGATKGVFGDLRLPVLVSH